MAFPFVRQVLSRALWGASPFFLVDVGASGGIGDVWSTFGERLRAVGFDPLVAEVERLNAGEARAAVSYEAAFVGFPRLDTVFPAALRGNPIATRSNQPFGRSSAVWAQELKQQDYVREQFNAGRDVEYARRSISLDERFADEPAPPDFIKIDTDGSDFHVLLGAERLIGRGVLGVEIESQFHGAVHEYANVFANIDRFMRERGFSLFDLSTWRYSRRDLPAPFYYDIAAQTQSGQVLWGDAVYFRDLAAPQYEAMFPFTMTRERALKLACLFELYGLPDCACELILRSAEAGFIDDPSPLLDALTPGTHGPLTYQQYRDRFAADPDAWLPTRMRAAARGSGATRTEAAPPVVAPDGSTSSAAAAIAHLTRELDETRGKVRLLRHRTTKMQQERETMRTELRELRARHRDERPAPLE
jgi:hypothetical protein